MKIESKKIIRPLGLQLKNCIAMQLSQLAKRFITTSFFNYSTKIINPLVNILRKGIFAYDIALSYRKINEEVTPSDKNEIMPVSYVQPIISYYNSLGNIVKTFPYQPKISILIPIYQVNIQFLEQTLHSVVSQKYRNWEICAVDDASNDPEITKCLETFKEKYPQQFHYRIHEKNLHISETSNTALEMATGEYIGLLDHDDLLYPNALAEMVRYINYTDKPDILYSDERVVNENGDPEIEPFLKPDYLPQLHLAVNYTTHFSVYRASLLKEIGGFRKGYEGSQDHDLMLRAVETSTKNVVHVPLVLYQWRAHKNSTANDISTKNYAIENGIRAVEDALKRRDRKATIRFNETTLYYDIDYELKNEDARLVSIIIHNKNNEKSLQKCVDSIASKSGSMKFEIIIVENNSVDQERFQFYEELKKKYSSVSIHNFKKPYNFAAINNDTAEQAKGDLLVFLDSGTQILSEDWLHKLVQLAQFPEIGSVGAKLLYPDGMVQHAGISLLDRQIGGYAWNGQPKTTSRYMNFLNAIHEVTAVTAACLCLEKKKFFEVGGFDDKWVPNGWSDVDFGLKLRGAGYTNIFTPHVEICRYESQNRGDPPDCFEKYHFIQTYGGPLMQDSFLHPFISRSTDFNTDYEALKFDLNNKTLKFFWQNHDWNTQNYIEYCKKSFDSEYGNNRSGECWR